MTPIDDLRVGHWVALVQYKVYTKRNLIPFDGCACQILAISLPFVAVRLVNGSPGVFDIRIHELQRVNRGYVKALKGFNMPIAPTKESQDCPRCANCGERLIERMIYKKDSACWVWVCERCIRPGQQGVNR